MKKLLTILCLCAFIGCAGQLQVGPLALRSPVLVKKSLVLNPADKLALDFSWPDRRPIAIYHLSDPTRIAPDNPAGWLDGPQWMEAYLARALPLAAELNIQSAVIWDLEGSSRNGIDAHGNARMYLGSPDLATTINPTVDYDSLFAKLRRQKIIPGLCLRPTEYNLATDSHEESADHYQTLKRKAAYARQRWGVRVFYVDSNLLPPSARSNGWTDGPLIPATTFARLHRALPDCLFVPEHWDRGNYHRVCAPYMELRGGYTGTPANIIEQLPTAFSVINVSGGDIDANATALRASIARGDIIAIDLWWRNPSVDTVKALYKLTASAPMLGN